MTNEYRFDSNLHLHSLNEIALTGTSSVIDVLAKPLTWWAAECAAVECLEAGIKIPTIREEYEQAKKSANKSIAIKELEKKYPIFKKARYAHNEYKKEAAGKGTDMHAELEHFVKAIMGKVPIRADYDKKIRPFIDWTDENVKSFIASEAHCYSEKLWIGGIVDAVAELNDGSLAVIDFKSSKEAYVSQFIQAAGYSIQIDENGLFSEDGKHEKKLDRKIDTLIVVPFGAEEVKPEIRKNTQDYTDGFKCAVTLYRVLGIDKKIKENNK